MKYIFYMLRPHQWIKNLFVLAPIFFAFKISTNELLLSLSAFMIFCMSASSIYIINDIIDIEQDKLHPTKCNRPIASGDVSKKKAIIISISLILSALIASYAISIKLMLVMITYIVVNLLYNFKLKHISVIDISIISFGFILRLFAGSYASDIYISQWIVLVTFQLALFLAVAKRRDDILLALAGKKTRKNIDGYNLELVNAAMTMLAGVTIVSYQMYTVSVEVTSRLGSHRIYLTTIFVIIGILRYMQITYVEQKSGSPTMIVYKDAILKFIILCWLAAFVFIVRR